jgi:hypothetical protein
METHPLQMVVWYFEIAASIVAVGMLWLVLKQVVAINSQMRANFHQEFARRYTDFLKSLPADALDNKNLSFDECRSLKEDFPTSMRLYWWIIQEEHSLHLMNKLPKGQWKIWDEQFGKMMSYRWIREAWDRQRHTLALPPNFKKYVDRKVKSNWTNADT